VCDTAFVVLVQRLEVQVAAAQQAAWTARVIRGAEVEVPSMDEAIDQFEAFVCSEPVTMDAADRELRDALGLRSGRG